MSKEQRKPEPKKDQSTEAFERYLKENPSRLEAKEYDV